MDNQARRLASLASEVNARDKMINRRLRSIEDLEKQVGLFPLSNLFISMHTHTGKYMVALQ